jgi:transcription elongation factor GreA
MADVTLGEAAARYIDSVKDSSRQMAIAELKRFVDWFGRDRRLNQLRGHDIAVYAETIGPATPENSRRADCIRRFLTYAKKEGLLEVSLTPHLRLRKAGRAVSQSAAPAQSPVELTREGVEALKKELEGLMEERVAVREEIRRAMLDKDFRENAPLDAAKNKQGHIEARIREIESMLRLAQIVEGVQADRIKIGTTVRVRNLSTGAVTRYVIVGPTEANAADGKISSVSPVGKALLDRGPGDEVEVTVPAGVIRLKIEEIEAS